MMRVENAQAAAHAKFEATKGALSQFGKAKAALAEEAAKGRQILTEVESVLAEWEGPSDQLQATAEDLRGVTEAAEMELGISQAE